LVDLEDFLHAGVGVDVSGWAVLGIRGTYAGVSISQNLANCCLMSSKPLM
jgi:hypothetical protein